jgi:hypothetical protein
MPKPIPISGLRPKISEVFTTVVHGHAPAFVQRGGRDLGLLIGIDELEQLLRVYRFNTEVLFGDDEVSVWLPEFALYGRGQSYAEAQEDLVDEVRDFVDDFFEDAHDYLRAPNRQRQFPFVLHAAVADYRGELPEVLFAAPDEPEDLTVSEVEPPARVPASTFWSDLPAQRPPGARYMLLTVHKDDLPSVESVFANVRSQFTHRWQIVELGREPRTYAESVAPLSGARPAVPWSVDD